MVVASALCLEFNLQGAARVAFPKNETKSDEPDAKWLAMTRQVHMPKLYRRLNAASAACGLLAGCLAPGKSIETVPNPSYAVGTFLPDEEARVGPWKNIYPNDPRLAGVSVKQIPEDLDDRPSYLKPGAHPCQVSYFFWDGRVNQIDFNPDGSHDGHLRQGIWFEQNPGPDVWKDVDFSFGSDPHFLKHQDPRKMKKVQP